MESPLVFKSIIDVYGELEADECFAVKSSAGSIAFVGFDYSKAATAARDFNKSSIPDKFKPYTVTICKIAEKETGCQL